ncbi:hypothetical protein EsDP_00001021 [Epichloe bromicola]|uniref:Uncharacterized protein n=1 Tax=Epichloe bromicola TaxID=79588 RepID=A0ABQ0CGL2_9HYPO
MAGGVSASTRENGPEVVEEYRPWTDQDLLHGQPGAAPALDPAFAIPDPSTTLPRTTIAALATVAEIARISIKTILPTNAVNWTTLYPDIEPRKLANRILTRSFAEAVAVNDITTTHLRPRKDTEDGVIRPTRPSKKDQRERTIPPGPPETILQAPNQGSTAATSHHRIAITGIITEDTGRHLHAAILAHADLSHQRKILSQDAKGTRPHGHHQDARLTRDLSCRNAVDGNGPETTERHREVPPQLENA